MSLQKFAASATQQLSPGQTNEFIRTIRPAVVLIRLWYPKEEVDVKGNPDVHPDAWNCKSATGFFINGRHIMTCCHALKLPKKGIMSENEECFVTCHPFGNDFNIAFSSGLRCSLVVHNENHDVAILRLQDHDKQYDYVNLASEPPFVGQDVHSISMCAQQYFSYDQGVLSNMNIQTNHEIPVMRVQRVVCDGGMSGAPVMNSTGEVIGIAVAILPDNALAILEYHNLKKFWIESGI